MKKKLFKILITAIAIYIVLIGLIYFNQESLIFIPTKLDKSYQFQFSQEFEEVNVKASDGVVLNNLLFKADSAKGVIFYLHGNAGSLKSWGKAAKTYTDLNYDVFMLDYRGYGKSEGEINGQEGFYDDIQTVYDELKTRYSEDSIIVSGYSIGTGLASMIASTNNPKLLLLHAPYYSLADLKKHVLPLLPTFILKYKFETYKYLRKCRMPIVIFHGIQDPVIYHGSSLKLKKEFKETDALIILEKQGHNGITFNPEYIKEIRRILNFE